MLYLGSEDSILLSGTINFHKSLCPKVKRLLLFKKMIKLHWMGIFKWAAVVFGCWFIYFAPRFEFEF